MPTSDLYATLTPTPYVIPISDGSGTLNDWITALVNPMTTDQDIIVGGVGGTPGRLAVGLVGYVLTVGSGGIIDWEPSSGGFVNPMTTSQDLIVGGLSGAPGRLGVGSVGQVLTVGSGGIVDWENPAASGGTVTSVSVVSANGFAGTVATATTTPAITLTTTITGILSGNGTAISAASTTGSGAVVLANTPTLITPVIGAATGTSLVLTGGLTSGAVAGVTGFVALKGLTSGTFTMSVNDAAGTWTAKWPATAGSNTNVLTTDGSGNLSWAAAGGVSGANPTASVGLTAVNGSATTYLRSDGAPALSQSIVPTWTGVHTFSPAARSSGVANYFTVNAPADTGITASTEAIGILFQGATRTFADGTISTQQREYVFGRPTYNKTTTSVTMAVASTLTVNGAPVSGSGVTITVPLAIWAQGGNMGFGVSGSVATVGPGGTGGLVLIATGTNQSIVLNTTGSGAVNICNNTTLPATPITNAILATYGTTQAEIGHASVAYTATAAIGGEFYMARARGSFASPSVVNSGDALGRISFNGYTTSLNNVSASIRAEAIENFASGAAGSKLIFATTPATTVTRTDAVAILSTGQLSALVNITSTSTTTGSIISAGGLGVAGAVFTGGAITTGTPSGGTAGAWKFGILVTAAVVPDTTRYIQLDVGGTTFKLIIST